MKNLTAVLLLACPLLCPAQDNTRISQVRDSYPQLSPDGAQIVFQSNRSGSNQVWVMSRDGSGATQLTQLPGEGAETPVWSPDGQLIAFARYLVEGNNDVFLMKPDGSQSRRLTFGPGYDGHPHFSSDGQRIVFNSDRDTPDHDEPWNQRWHDIWSIRLDGKDPVKHTDCRGICTYGSLSPDGRSLLYRKVDQSAGLNWALDPIEKNSEVYLADRDGSNARNLSASPAFDGWPAWSPDGAWIAFASNRSGPALTGQLWLIRPDGSGLTQLTRGRWGHVQPSWSSGSDHLAAFQVLESETTEYGGVALVQIPQNQFPRSENQN